MTTNRIDAGADFPELLAYAPDGTQRNIAQPEGHHDWMMVVIYRGAHCPMCTRFLNRLGVLQDRLAAAGIDLAVGSADNQDQLKKYQKTLEVALPMYFGIDTEALRRLGVYISSPRSPKETDHDFPEPALFVINQEGVLQVVDFSNNPFARPEPEILVSGLEWIRNPENHYPIRGMG